MGDRGNIKLDYANNQSVYFYTHWSGSELNQTVREALDFGRERWDDPPYLARIIFCKLVEGHEVDLTGFGIDVEIGDGDDQVVTVDLERKTVISLEGDKETFEEFTDRPYA